MIRPPMVVNARAADELYGKTDAAYTVPKFQHYSMEVECKLTLDASAKNVSRPEHALSVT